MKLTSLLEDIFAKGDELMAAVNDDTRTRSSTEDAIVTNKKPLGKLTSMTRGEPVYYAFSYLHGDKTTKLLKSLKGSGPYTLPASRRDSFLEDSAEHIASQLKKMKVAVDVIVSPNSSSPLLHDFATLLAKKLNINSSLLSKFSKVEAINLPKDKAEALALIKSKFIDHAYLDVKFKGDREKVEDEIAQNVFYNIRKNNGHIDAKSIFKQYGKFVKGFIKSDLQGEDEYSLLDKEVMVIDDVMSSGTTMTELFRIAKDDLGAAKVFGVSLFGRTSKAA